MSLQSELFTDNKKILIICPFASPNLGGVESHITKLLNYLSKKKLNSVLLTYQPLTRNVKGLSYEKSKYFEIYRFNWFGVGLFNKLENYFPLVFLYLFPGLFFHSFFYYFKNHKNIGVIHAHGLASAVIAIILSKLFKVRIVVSTHAVYNFRNRYVLRKIILTVLKNFDSILAVSELSKQEIIEMGISNNRVKVHPNWIETDVFSLIDKTEAKQKLNLLINSKNLLFVGRLIEKKGIKQILESAVYLKDISFHIVGTGDLEDLITRTQKNSPNIKFYGPLMQNNEKELEHLLLLYNACDYLISPYKYDEGFSTTLIESLSCGTPLIITNRGSPPTFLDKSVYIPLSKTFDKDELINTISKGYKEHMFNRHDLREYAITKFGDTNADIIIKSYYE